MNAFEVLGLSPTADAETVKTAYRTRVKLCHPDQFVDEKKQAEAQEELIRLNIAYEEALKMTAQRQVGYHTVSLSQAKAFAEKLYDQGNYETALRQLGRAEEKDADYYYIQGKILMAMKQYDSAHQAFRVAVDMNPDNLQYRRSAFDAALEYRKHSRFPYKVVDWADGLLHPRKLTK